MCAREKRIKKKNRGQLTILVDDYGKVLEYLEIFYEKFKNFWDKECKPNGFEVQQVRIGGMIERVKRCKNRLQKFVLGEIECIEELDEKLVPMKETENGLPEWNGYCASVTVNIL